MHTTLNAERETRSAEPLKKIGSMPISTYAQALVNRKSKIENSIDEWIGTAEAVKLTGYSERTIQRLCDEGFFAPGIDWKQRPPMAGKRQGGRIFILRSALKKLEGER